MRIVDVNGFYAPQGGGVRAYVEWKLVHAARTGHEVVVIAPGPCDRIEHRDGGAIHWVAAPAFPLDRRYRMFTDDDPVHRLLDDLKPDVVEASSPWRTAGIVARWRGDAPRHWIMHADPLASYAYRWFGQVASQPTIDRWFAWFWRHLRTLAPSFSAIVCANRWLMERLRAGGIGNARVIPFGVEPGVFSPALRDPGLRARMLAEGAHDPTATLLLGVGRHSPEKNWPFVIAAVEAASAERPVALLLVGEGRDQAELVKAIGGNPHIRLLAPISERPALASLMASADALIHGCDSETFCFVVAEAAASGIPAIVPDRGAAVEAAGAAARRYRPGDVADAARTIVGLGEVGGTVETCVQRLAQGRSRTMRDHFDDVFGLYGEHLRWAA